MFGSIKSVRGYTCAQLFTDGHGFSRVYPMKSKGDAHHALMQFIHEVGIPKDLLTDGALEEMRGEWGRIVKQYHIHQRTTEPKSPWQNRAESEIREIKKLTRRALRGSNTPSIFWCYALEWASRVRSLTALDIPFLKTRTPEEHITCHTPDISEYAYHGWFDWVWYKESTQFPEPDVCLGRWLGVASNVGQAMTYWILTEKRTVIARSSISGLSDLDKRDSNVAQKQEAFMARIGERGAQGSSHVEVFPEVPDDPVEPYASEEINAFTPEEYDEYISAQVIHPIDGSNRKGRVLRRKRSINGDPIGLRNTNPLLDTREYDVIFPDGAVQSYLANDIAEGIYSQADQEGHSFVMLSEIIDHEVDDSAISDTGENQVCTTKGWHLIVAWKDGTSTSVPLREMKNSYPLETAEYAINNKLDKEPAFAWWVPHVIRKKARIISKVKKGKKKYWDRTHKYGIKLPKSVQQDLDIDRETGTTYWRDAIAKEMQNVIPAFKFNDDDSIPVGYKHITCHMIFDIKMVGLVHKARFVAGGHLTDPPVESVYSSVVTRESVRIVFLIAALNDVDILGADVQNAYINAKTNERVYTTTGPEFGANAGRPAIIVRALYGLKSSGAWCCDHFASILMQMGFKGSKADPDVWMRRAKKPSGDVYWEYVLCYVDDVLAISHAPKDIRNDISKHVKLKPDSIPAPITYLGANVSQCTILDGDASMPMKQVWTMSAQDYIRRAIEEVERELKSNGAFCLPKKAETPFSHGYRPELDMSSELDHVWTNYFQGLIGILRWIVELGRIDSIVPVSLLSRYLVSPRKGHLEQAYRIFAYLKQFNRPMLVFDDAEPKFDDNVFHQCNWSSMYPEASEQVPSNTPEALGRSVITTCYVNADHAGCKATQRSHTGVLIYVNCAPIV